MRLPNSNVFWSGAEAVTSALLSFASAFIVARLVGPAEVGIGAAAVTMHVLLWVGVNALFADALVQRATIDETEASSAFWASVLVGLLAALLQAALGVALAASLGDRRLIAMSLALALPLPAVGAGGAMQGMLTRNRDYRGLAGRAVIGQGLGTLGGIALAMAGAGAWAMVGQQFVTSAAGALTLGLRSRWRPRPILRWQAVRPLLAIGLPLTASTLLQLGRYRVFTLLVGADAGAAVLGQVHMAFRLVETVRDLAITALWRLILPALAACQHDLPGLHIRLARMQALSGLVLFPAMGAMLVCVHPLVRLLLGPVWVPCSDAATVLLLLGCWIFLAFPASVAVVALGAPRVAMFSNAAVTLLTIAAVQAWPPHDPWHAAWLWLAAQAAVIPATTLMTARVLRLGVLEQFRPALAALLLAGVATAAALLVPALLGPPRPPLLLIAARLATGIAVYGACVLLLLRGAVTDALHAMGAKAHVR